MKKNVLTAFSVAVLTSTAALAQLPVPLNISPSRIAGHLPETLPVPNANPNLVEGRELFNPLGLALDATVTPPILYVADNGNQRVLGWKNATAFRSGAPADLVIGQSDFVHTQAQGTGTNSGFTDPTAVAVDSNGNLYVADRGNNRILRFPKPFAQQNGQFPDLVIGQPNLSTRTANYPTGTQTDQGLNLAGSPWPTELTFDADKNLWVTDGGNRRVLRFSAADLSTNFAHASLVLGQPDFVTLQPSVAASTKTTTNIFAAPFDLAFDSNGRLFISDGAADFSVSRVLVFTAPFSNGQSATRTMGVVTATAPTQDTLDKTILLGPASIFFPGSKVGLVDTFSHRILLFDAFEQWSGISTAFSPQAATVVGQPDYNNRKRNGTKTAYDIAPSPVTFSGPFGVAYFNNELYLSDTGNNRVIVLGFNGTTLAPANRVLGQDSFTSGAQNLIEGREFDFISSSGSSLVAEGGVAIDESSDTPHLYVADTYNHRVLGFKDFRRVQGGAKADIVIGQADFSSNLCNMTGNPDAPTNASLCLPMGVTVDSNGDLYVADTGNGRVLRFQAPFARQTPLPQADLVLGQRNFTSKITDAGAGFMSAPYGLAISPDNGLFASDVRQNRVLYFPYTNGSFTANDSGKAATKVFGQQDFTSTAAGATDANLSLPRHISVDNEARLYVADTGNNRVVIYDQINLTPATGAHAALALGGLTQPRGVFVNPATSEIWVAEGGSSIVKRYDRFVNLLSQVPVPAPNCTVTGACVQAAGSTLAVTQDKFGDLIVADSTSRVQFYYPGAQGFNGAHFLTSNNKVSLAPGLLTSLCSPNSGCDPAVRKELFGTTTAATPGFPLPQTLRDAEVWFGPQGGALAKVPLYYVSPGQINFVVPMNAPQSGFADIQVVQPSTGRILAAGVMPMTTVNPGILQREYSGKFRQAAVVNEDGTVNSASNPAKKGSYVSVYATGQGFVPNSPADGELVDAATGKYKTPLTTRIFLNGCSLDDSCVQNTGDKPKSEWLPYSGLSQFPGLWQINFYIPSSVAPGSIAGSPANSVLLTVSAGNSVVSGDGSFNMVIYVK